MAKNYGKILRFTAQCLHFLLFIPAPRLRGGKLRESTLVNKMDTRLRGYDTFSGWVESCKVSTDSLICVICG